MILSKPMQGLLDKEWRHSRGYLLATLLLLIYAPVIKTIFYLLWSETGLMQWGQELNYALHLGMGIRHPSSYTGIMEWLPFMSSTLLGIIILGEEQRGSLQYLVSTPVSRRQIILAKFFPGAAAILLGMLINTLFLMGLTWLYPMSFNGIDVLNWALLAGSLCLACFTMALMVATFTTGILAAGAVVFLLGLLPGMFTSMIENIAARYFAVSQSVSIHIYTIGSYFDLHDYITRSERHITHIDHYANSVVTVITRTGHSGMVPDYLLESGLLLVGVLLFLALAVIIFGRISLLTGGSLFVSSSARKIGMGILALCISYFLVFPRAETLLKFSIYLVILTGLGVKGTVLLTSLPPRKITWKAKVD
ncbi:MAG: ABC transporter permease subunit [Syntrophomonas sp.]|jgi:ABC-type transport system involved in multi-copper enzyme maturation permease subunit